MAQGHLVEKAETVLEDLIRRYGLEGKLQEARLNKVWPQAVGPAIAAAARPVRVKNGVLLVQVKSSAWMQELSFRRRHILERLASYLPSVRIHHLDLRTNWQEAAPTAEGESVVSGPPWPSVKELESIPLLSHEKDRVQALVAHLSDEEMRETLQRTLTHEMQSRKWRIQNGWKACPRCTALFWGEEEQCPICRVETGQLGTTSQEN